MVDRINRTGANPPIFNHPKGTKEAGSNPTSSTPMQRTEKGEQVDVSDRLQTVITKLIAEAPPAEDVAKIKEIRQALADGTYEVDHDKIASELLMEYFTSDVTEGSDHESKSS
ncbi:MAG: flagellar biosynthesis anti-sigma factor FlgM [Legionellales bacterium]|nr:flagellar biosynthesis anti-sigma factor FlgM [Legionellales bacterium]